MCSIANLFKTNIRKFDAKKYIFCPECLDFKSLGKINFFKELEKGKAYLVELSKFFKNGRVWIFLPIEMDGLVK